MAYRIDLTASPLGLEGLTDSERDVLRAIAAGLTNKEIAKALSYSEETIRMRVRSILWKTSTRSRAHAVSWGYQSGELSVERD
jgi:DNA-binding NarL/FixJ family response regulator